MMNNIYDLDNDKKNKITMDLLKVISLKAITKFSDIENIVKAADDVLKYAKNSQSYDIYNQLSISNEIISRTRDLLNLIYNNVIRKSPPTNLIYFNITQLTIGQSAKVTEEDVTRRTLLMLSSYISFIIAFYETKDQRFLAFFDAIKNKFVLTGNPTPTFCDAHGDDILIQIITSLLIVGRDNVDIDEILSKINEALTTCDQRMSE